MFNRKQAADEQAPVLLERESRYVAHVNREADGWLGKRFEWFNKVRTAKKGGLKLFSDASLEEQMEATRSALNLVEKTVNGGQILALNSVLDQVTNAGVAPEGWLPRVEADRAEPPPLDEQQQAVLVAWMPLKVLNLAKAVRDKGKGLDFYSDGLIKKLYFRVLGFYSDPRNWDAERLGFFLQGLEADADLQTVQSRLMQLRTEVDMLAAGLQLFRFGRISVRPEAGQKNAVDELFRFSDEELVSDLYFQSFLYSGLEHFLFRYYLTLLSVTQNVRALHQLAHIFQPLLGKAVELHLRFQTSFATDREKVRLRKAFMEFSKQREALPPVETVQENGREVRRIHYTHRLIEALAFSRHLPFSPRQVQIWRDYLQREVLGQVASGRGLALLVELLGTLVWDTVANMEGKVRAARDLRDFTDEQEKLGKVQIARKKKALDEAQRNKRMQLGKFRSQEQANMVVAVQKELDDLQKQGTEEIAQLEQALAKRREAQLARVGQLEQAAKAEREKNLVASASGLYAQVRELDGDKTLRSALVPYLVAQLQEAQSEHSQLLLRNLFGVLTDLAAPEKLILRNAIAQKVPLQPEELVVGEEDLEAIRREVLARKSELNTESPGLLEKRLVAGSVKATVDGLLNLSLNQLSMWLLLSLPYAGPNQQPAKLPADMIRKLMEIQQAAHPMPEHDVVIASVAASEPALKRLNLNRLQKLLG